MKALTLTLLLACASAQTAHATLRAIDTFGSKKVSLAEILSVAKGEIEKFAGALEARDLEMAAKSQKQVKAKLEKLAPFAFFKLSFIQYPPPNAGVYVTVDLVDPEDRSSRMNFQSAPHGSFPDPAGLLAAWDAYQDAGLKLAMTGTLKPITKCAAFHCLVGFEHPDLQKSGELFNREVPRFENELYKILHEDQDAHHRAAAAFLLAYTHDGKKLVRELALHIRDESEEVRNNVLRVFGSAGEFHPEIDLPVKEVVEALNFPTATDRNKALFALLSISKRPDRRSYLIEKCGPLLVSILKLQQPNNHDLAYNVLKNLSGRDFGERGYTAWDGWVKAAISGR